VTLIQAPVNWLPRMQDRESILSFSLILSAMQVGLAVTPLNDNYVFGAP